MLHKVVDKFTPTVDSSFSGSMTLDCLSIPYKPPALKRGKMDQVDSSRQGQCTGGGSVNLLNCSQ